MDKAEILEKATSFFEKEYFEITALLKLNSNNEKRMENLISTIGKKHLIVQSRNRIFAVAMFCQNLGVAYEDINKIYEVYLEKYYELLNNREYIDE